MHNFKEGDIVKLSSQMLNFFQDFRSHQFEDAKNMSFLVIKTMNDKKINVLSSDGNIVEFRDNDLEKII